MKYMKAFVATGIAVVGSLTTAAADGKFTTLEILVAVGTGLVTLGGVAISPKNRETPHA